MILPRRFLPPLGALRALEAMDRLGSATAVAQELNLSQSAVSRQLQTLESHLGVTLFLREGRNLKLTPEAIQYTSEIRTALGKITQASMRLSVNPAGGNLTLAILPTFGMRWLVPRLPDFARAHPEITLNLTTRLTPFSFAAEPFDAAIRFGHPDWPGTDTLLLKRESMTAVAAPALLKRQPLTGPGDLAQLPLLHIETRPTAWQDWFAAHRAPTSALPTGTIHDQFATIIQAALHGLGVALLPDYLIEQELAAGRLRPAWGGPTEMPGAYYLVWPRERAGNAALSALRNWLESQAEDEDLLPR